MAKAEYLSTVTLTRKYQIVLPKAARERLDVKIGDKIFFVMMDGKVQIVKDIDIIF
ncbi:MAG: AbrB/MazE/SpoVT family DNA-binding domain-containing protein [Candidatus Kariarchaeaceae archaeon]|jgi:AbrB family looped-hinge helix DNA binding protein